MKMEVRNITFSKGYLNWYYFIIFPCSFLNYFFPIWIIIVLMYCKLYWPFTVRINCSTDLKIFANSRPSASNFKSFSRSQEQFFLKAGQNNYWNKISLFFIYLILLFLLHLGQKRWSLGTFAKWSRQFWRRGRWSWFCSRQCFATDAFYFQKGHISWAGTTFQDCRVLGQTWNPIGDTWR